MTTEDTLTAIDATLNGYVGGDWTTGKDAMRWSQEKPKPSKEKPWVMPMEAIHLNDSAGVPECQLPGGLMSRDLPCVTCPECLAWARSQPWYSARDAATYVENTTSREQEGQ